MINNILWFDLITDDDSQKRVAINTAHVAIVLINDDYETVVHTVDGRKLKVSTGAEETVDMLNGLST
jgi:hypothetical protein